MVGRGGLHSCLVVGAVVSSLEPHTSSRLIQERVVVTEVYSQLGSYGGRGRSQEHQQRVSPSTQALCKPLLVMSDSVPLAKASHIAKPRISMRGDDTRG